MGNPSDRVIYWFASGKLVFHAFTVEDVDLIVRKTCDIRQEFFWTDTECDLATQVAGEVEVDVGFDAR